MCVSAIRVLPGAALQGLRTGKQHDCSKTTHLFGNRNSKYREKYVEI